MEKTEESGVKQVALSGDRMGVLMYFGVRGVMASQGSLKSPFVQLAPSGQFSKNVKKLAMCGKRVVVLTEDGQVYGTSPDKFAPPWDIKWTGLLTDGTIANDIAVSDNRVLVLKKGGQEDGQVFVKEGDWGTARWVNITNNQGVSFPKMKKIAICAKRVLVLTEDGQVYGTSPNNFGPTWNGLWTGLLTDNTIDIAVSDNRVLVLKKDGQVFVKEGDWGAGWVNITNNQGVSLPKMKKIAMSAKRVIALTEQGQLYGTSPDNFGPTWNGIWTGLLIDNILADNIAVTDDRILVATNVYNEASTMVGDTFVKEGDWGAAWTKI